MTAQFKIMESPASDIVTGCPKLDRTMNFATKAVSEEFIVRFDDALKIEVVNGFIKKLMSRRIPKGSGSLEMAFYCNLSITLPGTMLKRALGPYHQFSILFFIF